MGQQLSNRRRPWYAEKTAWVMERLALPFASKVSSCPSNCSQSSRHQAGFTLFELILVVVLLGVVYAVALPQLSIRTGTETAVKLGQLSADVRTAFDLSVLTGRAHRIAFRIGSGEYVLETIDQGSVAAAIASGKGAQQQRPFLLGDQKLERDPTPEDVEVEKEDFIADFEEYEELRSEAVELSSSSGDARSVAVGSPVLDAKDQLEPIAWVEAEEDSWGNAKKSIGRNLFFSAMQAEHHDDLQTLEKLESESPIAYLYFLPTGYVEKAFVFVRVGELTDPDPDQPPYTLVTEPYVGTAEVRSGEETIDFEQGG